MKKAKIFCLCLDDKYLNDVKKIGYIPVGLGKNNFSKDWLTDDSGDNISNKNPYYGEYSFHYWLWKNELKNIPDNTWVGFCTYRRFWSKKSDVLKDNFDFNNSILDEVPDAWQNYDVILGNKITVKEIKLIKILKYGKSALCRNPGALFKKGRNIKFQFDMFHGNGMLDKAINLLNDKDKVGFQKYVTRETSFNSGNMYVCRSKKIMKDYYTSLFNWLNKCEHIFGFDLDGYSKIRIYAFLAERFLPYWFNEYTKVKEWPILFYDLNEKN